MADFKEILDYTLQRVPDAAKIHIKSEGFELSVERGGVSAAPIAASAAAPPMTAVVADAPKFQGNNFVKAELIGVFYSAPSPDAPPFVKVGQAVKKGDVICIIEAMKMMNEIECPCDGTVAVVLAENGAMVEYGQPLFEIRP
jgi:acetyl-CoA carboxylase biotin carboxyl carrier protein